MKRCNKCGQERPLADFHLATGARDGRRGECKACAAVIRRQWYEANRATSIANVKRWQADNRERHLANQRARRQRPEVKARERGQYLRRKFGITQATYDEMLEAQGGKCAICGRPPREDISLHVDHEHGTGRVRGLLCFRCNNALGDFDDDPVLLRQAIKYLARTN